MLRLDRRRQINDPQGYDLETHVNEKLRNNGGFFLMDRQNTRKL